MKKLFFSFTLCILGIASTSQTTFSFASKASRDSVEKKLKAQIHQTLSTPIYRSFTHQWVSAFWAMELMLYKPAGFEKKIPQIIHKLPEMDTTFQRAFLEMLYTLYLNEFSKQLCKILPKLNNHKVVAMTLEYLAKSKHCSAIDINDSFHNSLFFQLYKYNREKKYQPKPAIKDFLHPGFLPGQTVLCSFQSSNRNKPGFLMIRLSDGSFMKNEKGQVLKYPQLARSISNLPFYLTNGNTPQGLYKINGIDTSTNNWIGPTTNLQMIMPFENEAGNFFGTDTAYYTYYQNLLGPYLQKFKGLYESYWAGKIGRTEIIAHGTAINHEFYRTQPYYPHTPSLGCLCSPEIWNKKGQLVYSAQKQWIQFIEKKLIEPTYLVVADVIDL